MNWLKMVKNIKSTILIFALQIYSALCVAAPMEEMRISSQHPQSGKEVNTLSLMSRKDAHAYINNDAEARIEYGQWRIDDVNNVKANYICSIDRGLFRWPSIGWCRGFVSLSADYDALREYSRKEMMDLRESIAAERDINPFLSEITGGMSIESLEASQKLRETRLILRGLNASEDSRILFRDIYEGDRYLVVDDSAFVLENFDDLTNEAIEMVEHEGKIYVKNEKIKILVFVLLGVIVFGVLFRLRGEVFGICLSGIKTAKNNIFMLIKKLLEINRRQRVRAVLMDEGVRVVARSVLNSADDGRKELLISELRKAIESGNHDLANALEFALKKDVRK